MYRFFWQESVCQSREAATGPENGALWRGKDFNFWTAVIRRFIVWVSKSTVAGWHYCLQQMLLSSWAGSYPYRVVRDPASARSYCPLADVWRFACKAEFKSQILTFKGQLGQIQDPYSISLLAFLCIVCIFILLFVNCHEFHHYDTKVMMVDIKLFLIFDIN